MRQPLRRSALILLILGLLACGGRERSGGDLELWPLLAAGGWVPESEVFDLRGQKLEVAENPALWVPVPVIAGEGWSLDAAGWHPGGSRAVLRFWGSRAGSPQLLLETRNRGSATAGGSYRVQVSLNREALGIVEVPRGRSRTLLQLPPGILAPTNELELGFEPPPVASEGERLPVTLLSLGLVGSGPAPPTMRSDSWQLDGEHRTLAVRRSGAFVLPLELPIGARELRLEARQQGVGAASLRVFIVDGRGGRHEVGAVHPEGSGWRPLRCALSDLEGHGVFLVLDVDIPAGAEGLDIRRLVLNGRPRLPVEEPDDAGESTAAGPVRERVRPDVVVVILDAARGDRFPGWGYPRQTLPIISRLASSALVFRHAYAECPTTSCSIPALISGVGFLSGGGVDRGRQLSDEVTTLAELLREAGYRTVAFSATPNNSAERNVDQGFDEFHKLWGRDNPAHGPFNLSRLASEVLRAQPRDEPLFLQLHYLPPHQPYAPEPEFDRFTAPDYRGPIHPRMSLKPYNLGLADLGGRDLDHLIGLYDGNLLLADAAVGQVLDTLRQTGRWDNTLLVVTSDHGEAFMEHGFQGHNTTLYDEMLHVPLILRLPGGTIPHGVDTGRLVSLLDVVPTLSGYLGISPPAEIDGTDLLGTTPDARRPRVIFSRTSHPRNFMVSARTTSWKAIAWPRRRLQMLFDLESDPHELVNLLGKHPWIFAGLGLVTRQHLEGAAARRDEGPAVELTAEAEEALRALGYLE